MQKSRQSCTFMRKAGMAMACGAPTCRSPPGRKVLRFGCTPSRSCRLNSFYNHLMLLAVLTVSDRCAQGIAADTAGPAVFTLLRQQWPDAEIQTALVPDETDQIHASLTQWVSHNATLILTVGGTGLGPRDRTPEA